MPKTAPASTCRCARERAGGGARRAGRRGVRAIGRSGGLRGAHLLRRLARSAQLGQINPVQRADRFTAARGELAGQDGGEEGGRFFARRRRLRGVRSSRHLQPLGEFGGGSGHARLHRLGQGRRRMRARGRLAAGTKPVHARRLRGRRLRLHARAEPHGRRRGPGQAHRREGAGAQARDTGRAVRRGRSRALRPVLSGARSCHRRPSCA